MVANGSTTNRALHEASISGDKDGGFQLEAGSLAGSYWYARALSKVQETFHLKKKRVPVGHNGHTHDMGEMRRHKDNEIAFLFTWCFRSCLTLY